jgi:hypothetical protein
MNRTLIKGHTQKIMWLWRTRCIFKDTDDQWTLVEAKRPGFVR